MNGTYNTQSTVPVKTISLFYLFLAKSSFNMIITKEKIKAVEKASIESTGYRSLLFSRFTF